jgi:hypothetical protein
MTRFFAFVFPSDDVSEFRVSPIPKLMVSLIPLLVPAPLPLA